MSTARTIVFAIAVLALATTFGCDDSSSSSPVVPDNDLMPQDLAFFNAEDALDGVEDMTLEQPMAFAGDFTQGHSHGHGPTAGPILFHLDLDKDQVVQIKQALIAGSHCTRAVLEEMREANQDVLDEANEQRAAIIEAYMNDEITREEAVARIRELSQATREAIRNDPDNVRFMEAICVCRSETMDTIRSILDTDQQAVWDSWFAGHDLDC